MSHISRKCIRLLPGVTAERASMFAEVCHAISAMLPCTWLGAGMSQLQCSSGRLGKIEYPLCAQLHLVRVFHSESFHVLKEELSTDHYPVLCDG